MSGVAPDNSDERPWETVVGLEVHVQLKTARKLFSPAPVRFGQPPNVDVDAVDTGLPGALPVLNPAVIDLAIRVGLACGSTIAARSVFARKHYFYPDLPKGFQITQHNDPILRGGAVVVVVDDVGTEKSVSLTRAHIEEDAGKSSHGDDGTRLDWNRAGTPLLEVVTEPVMSSGEEAMRFFRTLRALVVALDVCDGNLQEGSMRADANVSVRRRGDALGTRVELKNINSPRFLHDAVEDEARRQRSLLVRGDVVVQETRLWDADQGESRSMRSKEDAPDYRYVPDPDLPVVVVDVARLARARAALPELPAARKKRYVDVLGLSLKQAAVLVGDDPELTAWSEAALASGTASGAASGTASGAWAGGDGLKGREKALANWLLNDLQGLDDGLTRVRPAQLARLVVLVEDGAVAGRSAKELLRALASDDDVDAVVDARGLRLQQGKDVDDLVRAAVREVFASNPVQVEQVRSGKEKVKGFLVGQCLKSLKAVAAAAGADPKKIQQIVDEELLLSADAPARDPSG